MVEPLKYCLQNPSKYSDVIAGVTAVTSVNLTLKSSHLTV